MKLIYDEKDRLSEILGSDENGSFKDGELEFVTNYFNGLINTEKEIKIKALEEQRVKEIEFYKKNAEVAKATAESNAESTKATAESNAEVAKVTAKANSEASIASSNALVAFFTTVSVVALTTLALKKPELFENNTQQNPETAAKPSSLPELESNQFDPDSRAKPSVNSDAWVNLPIK